MTEEGKPAEQTKTNEEVKSSFKVYFVKLLLALNRRWRFTGSGGYVYPRPCSPILDPSYTLPNP